MYIIGVDVGGTNIKAGLLFNGEIIGRIVDPTNTFDLVKQINNLVKRLLEENSLTLSDVSGVGVGFPGIVIDGKIMDSANIGLKEFHLQTILAEQLGVNVKVINDGSLAILGEWKYGNGENLNNLVMITIGTGIGGGIIANGKLYEGNGGGELGHITFVKNGIPCGCGRNGCVEKYISYSALCGRAELLMNKMNHNIIVSEKGITANDLMNAYKNGDECAKIILDEYVEDLSEGILNYCNIFRPDRLLIGGGLSYSEDIIKKVILKCKEKDFGYKGAPAVEIVPAKLKNDAGLLGACVLFE